MNIVEVSSNKERFMHLLLIGDEQEDLINRYLKRGTLYALYDDDLKAVCVVTFEDDGVYEIKNISVHPFYHRKGYGRKLIEYIADIYRLKGSRLIAGTGEVPSAVDFYQNCGFVYSHRVENFFIDNYCKPMYEDGVMLKDMVYFSLVLQ